MSSRSFLFCLMLLCSIPLTAQTSFCPDDPPTNPWLADSPYPIYHRNSYGQASTCLPGIEAGDSLGVKIRRDITGGTSPWIYLSEKYPNGERTVLYSNSTHVFKFIDSGTQLVAIDSMRLDFNTLQSNGYNHLLTKNRIWFSYEPTYEPLEGKYSQLFKFSDADTSDPYSPIVCLDTFDFGDFGINRVNMYNLNYDGQVVWYSEKDPEAEVAYAGVIDQDFNLLDTLKFAALPDERINHNSISVDENNAFYIVTSHRLIQFVWDGTELRIGWEAQYDFVGDGPTGNFAYGSGTTPTLLGWGAGNDKLVVVADGNRQNNLVAFWRELPPGWTGIPGRALHFADLIPIPNARSFSNLFQSIENSPTAYGYEIALAQFNGFLGYDCDNLKGVTKFRWDTAMDRFTLRWTNDEVNMNGVLAYSAGSNLVYGVGKESDCHYYYYGLDWANGQVKVKFPLGREERFPDDPFYDQGVNHVIDEAGSIYYSGSRSLVKISKYSRPVSSKEPALRGIRSFPNPTKGALHFTDIDLYRYDLRLYGADGRTTDNYRIIDSSTLDLGLLPNGVYFLRLRLGRAAKVIKVMKGGGS